MYISDKVLSFIPIFRFIFFMYLHSTIDIEVLNLVNIEK